MATADLPGAESLASDANLLSRLDRAPVTRTLKVGIAVVILVWLVESFDIGLVSTVILVLQPEWGLSSLQVGVLGASATIGLVIGMIPAGRMADRFGRKKILIAGTAVFAVFTLLSAFATNYPQLVVLRVIAGLGEGAIFPVPYLMISELVNKKSRGRVMGYAQWILNAGYTLPALVGLWAVTEFSDHWSWRIASIIGGVVPLLILPALALWVPESPRFLLRQAQRGNLTDARRSVRELVEKIEGEAGLPHDESVLDPRILDVLRAAENTASSGMSNLFKPPYLRRSVICYAALTASFVMWYTFLTYAPTIFGLLGATKSNSLLFTAGMMLVSAFGVWFQGRLADGWGRKPVFGLYIGIACVGLVLMTASPVVGLTGLVIGAFLASWFGLGSFSVSKMYMAEQYPTRLRGQGTSLGEMISRGLTGGILVFLLPGLFASFGVSVVFIGAAVVMLLLTLPMLLLGQETSARNMEDVGTDVHTMQSGSAAPAPEVH